MGFFSLDMGCVGAMWDVVASDWPTEDVMGDTKGARWASQAL